MSRPFSNYPQPRDGDNADYSNITVTCDGGGGFARKQIPWPATSVILDNANVRTSSGTRQAIYLMSKAGLDPTSTLGKKHLIATVTPGSDDYVWDLADTPGSVASSEATPFNTYYEIVAANASAWSFTFQTSGRML